MGVTSALLEFVLDRCPDRRPRAHAPGLPSLVDEVPELPTRNLPDAPVTDRCRRADPMQACAACCAPPEASGVAAVNCRDR